MKKAVGITDMLITNLVSVRFYSSSSVIRHVWSTQRVKVISAQGDFSLLCTHPEEQGPDTHLPCVSYNVFLLESTFLFL